MFSSLVDRVLIKQVEFSKELEILEGYIENFIERNNQFSLLYPFAIRKGKRIRSVLYFLNWYEGSSISPEIKYKTIALIELFHFASILHDDIIDNNMIRRNANSFLKEYGHKNSIIFGDLLFVKVLDEFLKLHYNNKFIKNLFLKVCNSTAYGAQLERNLTINSSFQECLKVSILKTSSLFKLSCFLGSFLSSDNFQNAKMSAIDGLCFGILFQFQNDLNDYSDNHFEKSEDFVQKNITMPLLLVRDCFSFDLSGFLSNSKQAYDEIKKLMHTPELQTYAHNIFSKYLQKITFLPNF